ncbi:carboxypeptidase-like regulatory domain-containing protein [Tenacibaculum sp. nBUS_03]|uniref:carboxypeptidase-like regulatory domain-containing protein n=1 Tax=Tenacibaculum sp. nBUS_03 TaxID=3395320 RepID=UPI003EC129EF
MKKVIVFLAVCSKLNAQKIQLTGKILNKENKEIVAYANISFLDSSNGVSSNKEGRFFLEIEKKLMNKKVHISCLNFKDTIVFERDLQNKILFLKPENYVLNEIVISKKRNEKIILDKVKRRVIPMYSGGSVKMIAKYFPNYHQLGYYFQNIKIHFSRRGFKKSKFRIRIFSVDSINGKPKRDLLLKSIPISIKKKQKEIVINLENSMLEVPKNGFFVAFEKLFIPENEFFYEKGRLKKSQKSYSPVIGLTKTKELSLEDCKIFLFNKGKWWLSPKMDKNDKWVPAISVTLSN